MNDDTPVDPSLAALARVCVRQALELEMLKAERDELRDRLAARLAELFELYGQLAARDLAEQLRTLGAAVDELRAEVRTALLDRDEYTKAGIILRGCVEASEETSGEITAALLKAFAAVDLASRRLLRAALPESVKGIGKRLAALEGITISGYILDAAGEIRGSRMWKVRRVCAAETRTESTWCSSGGGDA